MVNRSWIGIQSVSDVTVKIGGSEMDDPRKTKTQIYLKPVEFGGDYGKIIGQIENAFSYVGLELEGKV